MPQFRARTLTPIVGITAALLQATFGATASAAPYKPVWLCRPGLPENPCTGSLETGVFSPGGPLQTTFTPHTNPDPPVDCFYVYPTVSAEQKLLSNLTIQAPETDVARYQAAYYASVCKVYAPMYHQVTNIGSRIAAQTPSVFTPAIDARQYDSILDPWNYFLKHYSRGRPFVLIGHSQGAFVLRELIAKQIDPNPKLRGRMLSAILYGGSVLVKQGSLVGGSFKHIPGCTSPSELGCVVSYSSFPGTPPADAYFGDSTHSPTNVVGRVPSGYSILCTNPAALSGGSGPLESVFPVSFPPGNGVVVPASEVPGRAGSTPFFEYNGSYTAECAQSLHNHYLQVTPVNGVPPLLSTGVLAPDWGLHPLDANLALGNMVNLIASQTTAYFARSRRSH